MTPQYESVVLATFYDFLEKEFVYKGLRSVYWCIYDRTALAEAEVEYENHTSPTVWVKYRPGRAIPARLDPALAGKKVFTIIWTTTPWTLPASMAVAFHPDAEYVALESAGEVYIVAEQLVGEFAGKVRTEGDAGFSPASPAGNWRHASLPIHSSTAPYSACSPITSPWIKAPAWSTPPLPTAPMTSTPA